MLQQYDARVKGLEGELAQLQNNYGQQIRSKDDQIRALQEQVNTWRTKYEALAKLYSQLRHEHLDLLQKFKSVQLKAASAQEAIDRREKLEREIKTKNLELADMIRERDRALHEKDRVTGSNRDEVEKLKRELRMALDRADNLEKSKGNELSTMLSKYNREMADLEEALRNKSRALEDVHAKMRDGSSDLEQLLREKEEELEVYKAGMDHTLIELNELKLNQGDTDHALDGQIDALIWPTWTRSTTSSTLFFRQALPVWTTPCTNSTPPCRLVTRMLRRPTFCPRSRRPRPAQWSSRRRSTTSSRTGRMLPTRS